MDVRGRMMHSRLMGLVVLMHVMYDGFLMMSLVVVVIAVVMINMLYLLDNNDRLLVVVGDILNNCVVVDSGILMELVVLLNDMGRLLNYIGARSCMVHVLMIVTDWMAIMVGERLVLNIVPLMVAAIDVARVVMIKVVVDRMLMLLVMVLIS